MKERLQQLLSREQLTPVRFAELVGVQRSSVSHILSGRNNPSLDFIQKILLKLPHISSDWLINGLGEIYRDQTAARPAKTAELFEETKEEDQPPYYTQAPKTGAYSEEKPGIETSPQSASGSLPLTPSQPKAAGSSSSEIERIIVFYNDRSFREYHPE